MARKVVRCSSASLLFDHHLSRRTFPPVAINTSANSPGVTGAIEMKVP